MGNTLILGPPQERLDALNATAIVSEFPPWICMPISLGMDMICEPIGCRTKWRNYLPFNLSTSGNWFDPQLETYSMFGWYEQRDPYITWDTFLQQKQKDDMMMMTSSNNDVNVFTKEWFQLVYEYMFLTPSTSLANMFLPISLCTVLVLVVLIRIIKSFCMPKFRNIGREWALKTHGNEWLKQPTNQERIMKFGEYIFRLIYHSFVSLWGIYLFWNASWWNDNQGGTINLFTSHQGQESQIGMIWYYLIQGAYNAEAMIGLLETSFEIKYNYNLSSSKKQQKTSSSLLPISIGWAESVRSDFTEMMVHHVVTNALVFLSSYFRHQRIGSMVFWMHDLSDVPVDLAKLANFMKKKTATVIAFFTLCIVWIITRLYAFPFIIWKAAFTQSIEMHELQNVPMHYLYMMQPIFVYLLGMLVLLHCFWFGMFIKMGYVLVTTGKAADYSEKSENGKLKST